MTLYIRNMVCGRCIKVVTDIFRELGLAYEAMLLGEVSLTAPLTEAQEGSLRRRLAEEGFELIDDRRTSLIESIKRLLIRRVGEEGDAPRTNLSDYLTDQLHLEYTYLSHLFSSVEGMTIEKYYIAQKIEKVKELLVYGELSLSEIAFRLGYSSVQHLSSQFRKVTGLTPSHFKAIGAARRKPIDRLD